MKEAIAAMMSRYPGTGSSEKAQALREILQELALLGLWRAKFFEKAAFYGGTALRLLYGLDRFSEDLDFSLLATEKNFKLSSYLASLEEEIRSFGFQVSIKEKEKAPDNPIKSAFLKTDTRQQLLVIGAGSVMAEEIPKGQLIKIRFEVDVEPAGGFSTEMRYLLRPVPFPVKAYSLPDLFAGKMHAILCRTWKSRVKGRDWYDLVWYAANHPELNLSHLEAKMRQTGHWKENQKMDADSFRRIYLEAVERLEIKQARQDIEPFIRNQSSLEAWSKDFFRTLVGAIRFK